MNLVPFKMRLYDNLANGFNNTQPMQAPVGLAYALRHAYNFGIEDEKKSIKISIEEYEEQDDNNDCSN